MPRPASRKASNAYHHGDLREALIETALSEIEKHGHEAVSFSGLARALSVSQAAPYRHFEDRDALFSAVSVRGFNAFNASVHEALGRGEGSRLRRLAHAYVRFGLSHPGLYALMFSSGVMPCAPEGSPVRLAASESFDLVLRTLPAALDEEAQKRFGLKAWAAMHGLITLAQQQILPPADQTVSIEELVDELVHDAELAMDAAVLAARGG